MNFRQITFQEHRNVFFCTLAAGTSAFAFSPTSTILPSILAISTLLVYSPFLFRPSDHRTRDISFLVIGQSLGSSVFRLKPSLDALSTPGGSIAALWLGTTVLSALSVFVLFLSTKLRTRINSPISQLAIFPALWATLWCVVAELSPVGHLSTWSVANHVDAYNWVTPIFGSTAKDWIVGSWAVVLAGIVSSWYMGTEEEEIHDDLFHLPQQNNKPYSRPTGHAIGGLATLLVLLTIPSFILPNLSLPPTDTNSATSISIGCIIPPRHHYKDHIPTLQDYITESVLLENRAKILLWPEGAVTFYSKEERETAFTNIRERVRGSFTGVSFEEVVGDPSDPAGEKHFTQTGLALIDHNSNNTYIEYYKRHLVPVAESYRLRHSTANPTMYEMLLPPPRHVTKAQWGNNTRPLLLTASICLDFATPSPFSSLESRPGLILAPARTWDRAVGQAMWLQAKQRAAELNSMVLWCDGGEGGVSGIAGGGFNDPVQVGPGSFVQTIGIEYPFDSRRTVYARFGDISLILYWILASGPQLLAFIPFGRSLEALRRMWLGIRQHLPGRAQPIVANLIDIEDSN